jgi:CTP:molybdopterin cytidylyltransferase MocA
LTRAEAPAPVMVLAAGHGRRMGGPKALALWRGRAFLAHILERCAESGSPVTLVADPALRERLAALAAGQSGALSIRWVESGGSLPMLASVQAALALGGFDAGCWLWPVDAPFLSAAGWARLSADAAEQPGRVLKPRAGGRNGHPVWFPAWAVPRIAAGRWQNGLLGFLAECRPEQVRVLDLPGEVVADVNTPEELERVEADTAGETR